MSKKIEYALRGAASGKFYTIRDGRMMQGTEDVSTARRFHAIAHLTVGLQDVRWGVPLNCNIVRITTETAEPTTSRRVIHIDAEIPEGAKVVGYALRAAAGLSCGLFGGKFGWTGQMSVTADVLVFEDIFEAGTRQRQMGANCIMQVIEETTTTPEPVVTIEEVA